MFLGGRIAGRIGGGWTAAIGLVITLLATAPMAVLPTNVALVTVEALTLPRGLGVGLVGAPLLISVFTAVRREDMTDAASTMNIVQRLGGSLGRGAFVMLLGSATHPDAAAFHLVFACMCVVAALDLAAALLVGTLQQRTTVVAH